ncbi:MAG: amidophosphoribosyltransferase [Candidatus Krumholzibacteria bacterium]|nr:amidophosphoribosyltransferase [Candidatus Krumholzibacteria bacterium]
MSGLFGVVSENSCNELLLYGTDYHSHLGTEFGGVAMFGEEFSRQIHNISQSQFKSKFYEDISNMKGNMGIGVVSAFDEQPIYLNSHLGPFCIVTDGFIDNARELADQMLSEGVTFSETGDGTVNLTELAAKIIARGTDIVDGIEKVFEAIEGSCTLLLLNRDGIYAARDRLGYSALAIAKRDDAWAVGSETTAFPNNDLSTVKFLEPGEIVLLGKDGMRIAKEGRENKQICAFLWIYTGFPASDYEGINTEAVRERCGKCLARRDKDIDVDVVAGIPDSGTAHAIGYAIESGKPYRRPLIKYTPGYGRSYTPPSQDTRDHIARMKLVPVKEIIDGNKIVICEDSIVRGTQLKNFTTKKLWEGGAKEIHCRPACPPLMFPCRFNLSTREIDELAARRAIKDIEGKDIEDISEYLDHTTEKYAKMIEWIRKDIEVTTLRYQTVEDMVEAIGFPRERLCLYCWNGEYPGHGK